MIRAFVVTAITFAYILILGPPILLYSFLSGDTDRLYRVGVLGARLAIWLASVKLDVQGREKIPLDQAVVFMANHQGNCDPPAIFPLLPPVVIMVKKELFRVPILGRAMRMRDFVPVDRKNREGALQAVEEAVQKLGQGKSLLVFPEGTRSPDGRLQAFKKGVFILALKAGVPIVPISISGSSRIMTKGKMAIHPGRVRITLHDPVSTQGLTLEDREILIQRVRQAILAGLAPDEWPLDTPSVPTSSTSAAS